MARRIPYGNLLTGSALAFLLAGLWMGMGQQLHCAMAPPSASHMSGSAHVETGGPVHHAAHGEAHGQAGEEAARPVRWAGAEDYGVPTIDCCVHGDEVPLAAVLPVKAPSPNSRVLPAQAAYAPERPFGTSLSKSPVAYPGSPGLIGLGILRL